jgi:hypothetical protein
MTNFHELDFFENPFKSTFVYPDPKDKLELGVTYKPDDTPYVWFYKGKELLDVLNPEIITWAKENKLDFEALYIFLMTPKYEILVHTDGFFLDWNPVVINWVVGDEPNSYMSWHGPIDNKTTLADCVDLSCEDRSLYYLRMDANKLKEIERHTITGPTLVRVNQPHRGVNESDKNNWFISLRFINKIGNWDKVTEKFKPYIKK